MCSLYPLKFKAIAQQRLWGGNQLKTVFCEESSRPIGEYWVLSSHPNGSSVVVNGEFAGKTLPELIDRYSGAYLGVSPQNRFPLLIKFLEATKDLSVQIHPDDEYASHHEGDCGKTEAWYVLDCKEDGVVNLGHTFQNRDEYLEAVRDMRVKDYLRYTPIQKGQMVYVPSRTLHALLAGTIVLEIQQTSDVTYRVYDWDRVDNQGNPRELHVEKAADVLTYENSPNAFSSRISPRLLNEQAHGTLERMVTSPYFTIDRVTCTGVYPLVLGKHGNPDVMVVVEGEATLEWSDGELIPLKTGDAVLIPSTIEEYEIVSTERFVGLRTFY